MPISIRKHTGNENEKIAWLCDGDWELPSQIETLEKWLIENEPNIVKGSYTADVGFSVRPTACGGGAVVSTEAMKIMSAVGMDLYLSEYQ